MDVAALSIMISQSSIQQQASLSVMKLAMDTAVTQANSVTEMIQDTKSMQASVQPHLGSNIDVRI